MEKEINPGIAVDWKSIFVTVPLVFIILIIFLGNLLVILAISREHSLKPVQHWFIASLAVTDMLIGVVVVPFSLYQEVTGQWPFGYYWCQIHSALDVLLCTSSILHLCLIALDRYWSITKAIEYVNWRTPNICGLMLMTVWTLSTMISIPPLFYPPWGIPYNFQDEEDCEWTFSINKTSSSHSINSLNQSISGDQPTCYLSETTGYVMYSVFGSFYIPTCIMVFVYIKIFIAARKRAMKNVTSKHETKENIEMTQNPSGGSSLQVLEKRDSEQLAVDRRKNGENEREKEKRKIARAKERRAIFILGLIMGSFILCWLPFFFLYSISPLCPLCTEQSKGCCIYPAVFSCVFWLGYSNSAINPIIYTVFNQDFRRAFHKIVKCK